MVVDTSIFIEFLRSKNKKNTRLFQISEDTQFFISSITLYELMMGATSKEKKEDIEKLTGGIPVLSFDEEVATKAGEIYHQLRKENRMIDFRDIFIASTCIVNNLPLLTSNVKHFNRIQNLNLL